VGKVNPRGHWTAGFCTQDFSVERMMRDAKLTQIYTGTHQIARMVTGRTLLLS
jgi:alkylation response protein AidB-like acyl-CoA dehydrogenase